MFQDVLKISLKDLIAGLILLLSQIVFLITRDKLLEGRMIDRVIWLYCEEPRSLIRGLPQQGHDSKHAP